MARSFSDNLGWGTQPHIHLLFLMRFGGVNSQHFVAASAQTHKLWEKFRGPSTLVEILYEI